ncbi:MAG: NAD(P)/FAD-dependent oxidoreductase [Cyanobacteria bacterium M5B4]|nr:MAG: NAD(P)/FAD-dependent oxidoreductase [Cyanobacteria bacterium M5B4]
MNYDVIVVGGGLAGCSSAIHLADRGLQVLVLEQQKFPSHKLCGEFLSIEVIDSFTRLGVLDRVNQIGAHKIDRAVVTSPSGGRFEHNLPGTALGISRYQLDHILWQHAQTVGATCCDGTIVGDITGDLDQGFSVKTAKQEFRGKVVLGAYGKRSGLDRKLQRQFIRQDSPWIAYKTHAYGLSIPNTIELHGFDGGYCGLSMIETGEVNLCWIGHKKIIKSAPDRNFPPALFANLALADRLNQLHFNPGVKCNLGQICFAIKGNFVGDICMIGDTAGMITPFCGDGMAMALRSAEIAVPLVIKYLEHNLTKSQFKYQYQQKWRQEFSFRLKLGRWLHQAFSQPLLANLSINTCRQFPPIGNWLIAKTRGNRAS